MTSLLTTLALAPLHTAMHCVTLGVRQVLHARKLVNVLISPDTGADELSHVQAGEPDADSPAETVCWLSTDRHRAAMPTLHSSTVHEYQQHATRAPITSQRARMAAAQTCSLRRARLHLRDR